MFSSWTGPPNDKKKSNSPTIEEQLVDLAESKYNESDFNGALLVLDFLDNKFDTMKGKIILAKCFRDAERYEQFDKELQKLTPTINGRSKADLIKRLYALADWMDETYQCPPKMIADFFEIVGHIYLDQLRRSIALECFKLSFKFYKSSLFCIRMLCEMGFKDFDFDNSCEYFFQNEDPPAQSTKNVMGARKISQARIADATEENRREFGWLLEPNDVVEQNDSNNQYPLASNSNTSSGTKSDKGRKRRLSESDSIIQETKRPRRKGAYRIDLMKLPIKKQKQKREVNEEPSRVCVFLRQYSVAYKLYCGHKYLEAIEVLNSNEDNLMEYECLLLKATCFFESHQYIHCIVTFNALMQQYSTYLPGLEYYSSALRYLKEEQALVELKNLFALSILGGEGALFLTSAHLQSMDRHQRDAILLLEKAYQCTGWDFGIRKHIANSLLRYYTVLEKNTDYEDADSSCGSLYLNMNIYHGSHFYFTKLLSDCEHTSLSECEAAIATYLNGDARKSIDQFNSALKIHRGCQLLRFHRSCIHMMIGQRRKAIADLELIIGKTECHPIFNYILAQLYDMKGDSDKYWHHMKSCKDQRLDDFSKYLINNLYCIDSLRNRQTKFPIKNRRN